MLLVTIREEAGENDREVDHKPYGALGKDLKITATNYNDIDDHYISKLSEEIAKDYSSIWHGMYDISCMKKQSILGFSREKQFKRKNRTLKKLKKIYCMKEREDSHRKKLAKLIT